MSLPWFAFNIAEYVKDTMRLATEGHGAYLLLMLDYYANETPPPDDDDVLASIAKLPVDAWQARHRKVLAPFFRIEDGVWHHDRIEREILEANQKHAASNARATAGAAARWAGRTPKGASRNAQAVLQPMLKIGEGIITASRIAMAMPKAMPKQSLDDAHLHKHIDSLSVEDVTVESGNSGDNSEVDSVGTTIDPTFWPSINQLAVCKFDGADDETIATQVKVFIADKQESGSLSHDWDASFTKWWARWKDWRDQQAAKAKLKAPPRVVVSTKEPVELDWEAYAKRWASGMGWPRRGAGTEPGTAACRCPAFVLTAAGIDPATGLHLAKEKA